MEELAARGHGVVCLCTAAVSSKLSKLGVTWTFDQQNPYRCYTISNAGVYPALYSQGGVGTKTPLRDVHAPPNLRRIVLQILRREQPDVVNIQSLFGSPFELVDEIRQAGVPIVFTAHDYFALCPTAHLFLLQERPCRLPAAELICHQCCEKTPSYGAFWVCCQLDRLAQRFASFSVIRNNIWRLRNLIKRVDRITGKSEPQAYQTRRRAAVRFLQRIDVIHCISQRQAEVMQEICGPLPNIRVLPLMPPAVRMVMPILPRSAIGEPVSFVALNVSAPHKGAQLLEAVFRQLAQTENNYELHIYGNDTSGPEIRSVIYHGRYKQSDLDGIAAKADFCIVPSVCDETLGFVGLEMLARGVPVIASVRSGLSEFIEPGKNGYIFDSASPTPLTSLVGRLLRSKAAAELPATTQYITPSLKTFPDHVSDIETLLVSAIKRPTEVA